MEGGMRVPMIARWPNKIAAGSVCSELATTMDVLPTFCSLAGAELPAKKIDGFDLWPLLSGQTDAESKYEALFYYRRRQLQAIRWKDWKYHLPLGESHPNWTSPEPLGKGRPGKLVNLKTDLKEKQDVAAKHPKIMEQMLALVEQAKEQLGNDAHRGSEQREAATLDSSVPMLLVE